MSRVKLLVLFQMLALSWIVVGPAVGAPHLSTGEIVAEGWICGANSIFRIDQATGDRAVLSGPDPGNPVSCDPTGSGTPFTDVESVAHAATGELFVGDGDSVLVPVARVIKIDASTGNRSVVSGCPSVDAIPFPTNCTGATVGSGPQFGFLNGMLVVNAALAAASGVLAEGDLVAAGFHVNCFEAATIFRIDPVTGARTILSGLDDNCLAVGAGEPVVFPSGLEALSDGTILVSDEGDFSGDDDRVLTIDPDTGSRSVISGCSTASMGACTGAVVGTGPQPRFVSIGGAEDGVGTTEVFASGVTPGALSGGSILSIDPATGNRSTVSGVNEGGATSTGTGPSPFYAEGITLLAPGQLVFSDDESGVARLISVEKTTGNRTVLSGCSDLVQPPSTCVGPIIGAGPEADSLQSLIVVPEPGVGAALMIGAAALRLTISRRPASI
jgi:hypothetical protein